MYTRILWERERKRWKNKSPSDLGFCSYNDVRVRFVVVVLLLLLLWDRRKKKRWRGTGVYIVFWRKKTGSRSTKYKRASWIYHILYRRRAALDHDDNKTARRLSSFLNTMRVFNSAPPHPTVQPTRLSYSTPPAPFVCIHVTGNVLLWVWAYSNRPVT